jgi:hypothetical protein
VAHVAAPLRTNILKLFALKRPFTKLANWMYPLTVECEACVRKCIWGNCIKQWNVSRVDCIEVWKICYCGKSHFSFTQLSEAKFRCPSPFYHKSNGEYRIVGGRKTIPGCWRQVVDRTELMKNVAFIDSFNHRKVARAVCNRYAEHFCPQTCWCGSGKLFEYT